MTNVYFMQASPELPVKIGKSNNWKSRFSSHQTSNWQKLTIFLIIKNCPEDFEKKLQEHFKEHLIRGEWFHSEILRSLRKLTEIIILLRNTSESPKQWLIWNNLSYKSKLQSFNQMKNQELEIRKAEDVRRRAELREMGINTFGMSHADVYSKLINEKIKREVNAKRNKDTLSAAVDKEESLKKSFREAWGTITKC